MSFIFTTTGVEDTVVFNDLGGRSFSHPTTSFDLSNEFDSEEIAASLDIQTALDNNWITVVDSNGEPISNVLSATSAIPLATLLEAQSGASSERRAWSPERIRQAVEAISSAISLGNRISVLDVAGGQSVNGSFNDIVFDAEDEKEGFVFSAPSVAVSPVNDGLYIVASHITLDHVANSSRTNCDARLLLDGQEVRGTRIAMYHRSSSQGQQTGGFLRLLRLTAGQILKLQARRRSGTGTIQTSPDGTGLTLFEVGKGAKGDKGDTGAGSNIIVLDNGVVIGNSPVSEVNFKGDVTLTPVGQDRVDVTVGATVTKYWKRSESESNKTSTGYGTAKVIFSNNMAAGNYQVSWWYEGKADDDDDRIKVKAEIGGTTVHEVEYAPGGDDGAGWGPGAGSIPYTHAGGDLEVELFYASSDGNRVRIRRARIMVQKSNNVEL